MNTPPSTPHTPKVDSFLDSTPDTTLNEDVGEDFLDAPADSSPLVTLPEGAIDPRLQLLSHSSRTTLHKCPRKYQLYRLQSKDTGQEDLSSSVTFAYGSTVGVGIQSTLEGKTETQILLDMFLEWDADLLDSNPRQKKSFWEAVFAVQKFITLAADGYLEDYELVYHTTPTGETVPAVELSFQIELPNGFYYRGYVDVVLRQKTTDKVLVLELKTSSGQPNSTTYKNSGQALGYSVVLDKLFPNLSSYEVLYLVYYTRGREYTEFYFEKSLLQRALWLQELLIDCDLISLYQEYDVYPMHGESCLDFFRDCEYLGLCTLSTANLVTPLRQSHLDKIAKDSESYHFTVSLQELIDSQIQKGEV